MAAGVRMASRPGARCASRAPVATCLAGNVAATMLGLAARSVVAAVVAARAAAAPEGAFRAHGAEPRAWTTPWGRECARFTRVRALRPPRAPRGPAAATVRGCHGASRARTLTRSCRPGISLGPSGTATGGRGALVDASRRSARRRWDGNGAERGDGGDGPAGWPGCAGSPASWPSPPCCAGRSPRQASRGWPARPAQGVRPPLRAPWHRRLCRRRNTR